MEEKAAEEVDVEKEKRENLIEQRKRRFYKNLKKADEEEERRRVAQKKLESKKAMHKFESKRSSKTLDDIRDDLLSARSQVQPLDGVYYMDGVLKKTTTEYIEEGIHVFLTI